MKLKVLLCILLSGSIKYSAGQLKIGDQPTVQEKSAALDVKGSGGKQGLWLPRVTDTSITGIRSLNPPDGIFIYHSASKKIFLRSNNAWVTYLENAITSITAGGAPITGPAVTFNTGTAGINLNITSSGNTATWNLPDASTTARGAVTTGPQTFGGNKIFNDSLRVTNGTTLNGGAITNGGLTVSGAAASVSNLTLGITSATTPDTTTNKYLSVNALGKVTLNSVNVTATIPVKIKSYNLEINEAPIWINDGMKTILTFTVPGGNLSLSSTVLISPVKTMYAGFSINWARVLNSTTIQMAVSSFGDKQKLNPGVGNEATFNISVFEF